MIDGIRSLDEDIGINDFRVSFTLRKKVEYDILNRTFNINKMDR